MYADDIVTASPTGAWVELGVPIIPEVTVEGKELVFVVEIDVIKPANEN